MLPNSTIRRIARKEINLFFASPVAYLFLAAFAGVSLFTFFWGEAFFSRNIADVRPLFEWMPLWLIFLASALTMRMWSEERRTGTLEYVLTQPTPLWHFVAGKFLGCFSLLAIALLITLPLPITVAFIGNIDWGPVLAGYLATLLLGATYLSIGLFVSSRSENQIVSLICAVALNGFFYLIGSKTLTSYFGSSVSEWLSLLGTGSRFEAITRGVIDLRDFVYYLSLVLIFLALNTFSLERERWAATGDRQHHQLWRNITALLVINALGVNLWLGQLNQLRVDITAGNQYSISPATRQYLQQLQEPLLIRGYFSDKTHPLLAPLVPQLSDLIKEYEIAGKGKVRVELLDPVSSPELEQEANQQYAIKPVPFQVNDRYQTAVVNSYFSLLVKYGDDYQVLGFRDLIEAKANGEADVEVKLRNAEHDLTSAIKKVLHSYQAKGNLFDTVKGELVFNAYISTDALLPEKLQEFKKLVESEVQKIQEKSANRLRVNFLDPDSDGRKIAQQIENDYGFKPMTTVLLANNHFYFYLTLAQADQVVQIPLDDMTSASFERNLSSAIKRFATGFTKTLGFVAPAAIDPHVMQQNNQMQFNHLQQMLNTNLNIMPYDLSSGQVSGQIDILFLAQPKNLSDKQIFAVDQFLMQGGTVVLATSPYAASIGNRSLALQKNDSGLTSWLNHHGINILDKIVMDKQSVPFPAPVTRNLGGFSVEEMHMLDYPYFVDVRGDGLNSTHPITNNLPQVTMAWASPIQVDAEKNKQRLVTELLHSSKDSWLSSSTEIMPQLTASGLATYQPEGEQKAQLLGVIAQGKFDSYFVGKPSPLLATVEGAAINSPGDVKAIASVIQRSPESARIILFSSNDFLADQVVVMASAANGSHVLNSLQLLVNTFDWALEDAGLLSIRSRSNFNRTLPALEHDAQLFWEYLNYGLALLALIAIGIVQHRFKRVREQQDQQWLV